MPTVDWHHELVEQLAFHWQFVRHGGEGRAGLDDLTDEECHWEPVPGMAGLRRREQSEGFRTFGAGEWVVEWPEPVPDPPMTTLAWRLAHLAVDVFGERASNHFGDGSLRRQDIVWEPTAAFGVALLDEHYAAWMDGVRAMSADDLARPVGPAEGPWAEAPYATLVLHINREAIHHMAEICLLRDLHRTRPR